MAGNKGQPFNPNKELWGQGLVNICTVIGLLPVTGVPLPFISFGGSALVFTMAAAGMLLNISRHVR